MDLDGIYTIPLNGLGSGEKEYRFTLDDRFFKAFDGTDIKNGKADVHIILEKSGSVISLDIHIFGNVVVECDRCLDELTVPVDFMVKPVVRYGEDETSDDEIIWLEPGESELKLARYFYESVALSLPILRTHGTDSQGETLCNPVAAQYITGEDNKRLNEPAGTTLGEDPRLSILKELKETLKEKDS